ncbi:hypothetical protein AOP6_1869 [Desulfuromonas sp. AOP6]|nr:hypothetical protein AOP6_1869 [Desulfuromonas sp. AOP6]
MISLYTLRLSFRALALIVIIVVYYLLFFNNKEMYFDDLVTWINVPDHIRYINFINYGHSKFDISGINNYVITFIYSHFDERYLYFFTFLINTSNIILSYILVEKVSFKMSGNYLKFVYYFSFVSLANFSLMINKDSFTLLFVSLVLTYIYAPKKRYFVLLLVVVISLMKIQLLPILFVFLFIYKLRKCGKTINALVLFMIYFSFSVLSSILSVKIFNISSHNYDGFVSVLKYNLNENFFFIGSFFLNLLIPIQYIYNGIVKINYPGDMLQILIYFFLIISIALIVFKFIYYMKISYLPLKYLNDKRYPLIIFYFSFLMVSTISPIINFRYFLPFFPIILLIFNCKKY